MLTSLENVISLNELNSHEFKLKNKYQTAPELHSVLQTTLDPLAISVFGIGQLLFQIRSYSNIKKMKLRKIQEITYMQSFNFKTLFSTGADGNSKLISD